MGKVSGAGLPCSLPQIAIALTLTLPGRVALGQQFPSPLTPQAAAGAATPRGEGRAAGG